VNPPVRIRLAGGAALAVLVVGAALAAPSAALATKPAPEHKVTICHRTNSNTNPYVLITVDIASSGHLKGGHDTQHEGPVWDPTLKAKHLEWGDIIPPYAYQEFSYPGQNMADGGAILEAGCKVQAPSESPSDTPSETPSEEPTPSGDVEGSTGRPDPTPPATDTAVPTERPGDSSSLLLVLAAIALVGGLSADRARARARR